MIIYTGRQSVECRYAESDFTQNSGHFDDALHKTEESRALFPDLLIHVTIEKQIKKKTLKKSRYSDIFRPLLDNVHKFY